MTENGGRDWKREHDENDGMFKEFTNWLKLRRC
jgi:hypothetical protein